MCRKLKGRRCRRCYKTRSAIGAGKTDVPGTESKAGESMAFNLIEEAYGRLRLFRWYEQLSS